MARYANGKIPLGELLHLGGEHYLTPATAQRWSALREDVHNNEGVWLNITAGPNAYRDLDAQWRTYREEAPGNAAYPGTSSHGGVYQGRDSMAVDVGNYGAIGADKFYAYARKHGFEPGYFSWEPWHIIDWAPYSGGQGGGGIPAGAGAEMYIIRAEGRAPTLVGPGYHTPLSAEEAGNIGSIVSKDTTVNPRQFDLALSAATRGSVSGPNEGAFVASSPNRKKALIASGHVRELTEEEANNTAGLFTNRVFNMNDRQYDLAVAVALGGSFGGGSSVALKPEDIDKIAQVTASLVGPGVAEDVAELFGNKLLSS